MSSLSLPRFSLMSPARSGADIGPLSRAAVSVVGGALTLALAIALFKWATGLAPDFVHYRNWAITIHVITVIPAVPLGAYLLLTRKGTDLHKLLGRVWVGLMVTTAIAITFVRGGGDFSWIHIFVPYTLFGAWKVVATVRRGDIKAHRNHLISMYLGALAIPGAWSFLPDRLMGLWLWS